MKFKTPNIDKLAKQGMMFTQFYSGSTVCAPSCSALLTGMHTGHTVVRGNKEIQPEGQYPIPDDTYTLAEAMKDAGYTTGAFGKWGLGFPGSEGDPVHQGFDVFYGYNCQRLGHHYYPDHLWSNLDSVPIPENKNSPRTVYGSQLVQQQTLKFIEDNKDKPFFLYVPSIIPHAELAAPEEQMQKFRDRLEPGEPFKGTLSGPKYDNDAYAPQKETHVAFAAMVTLLDEQVGEIVKKVKDLGLNDNTLIIFTSDNGPHTEGGADPEYFDCNGIYRGTKRDLYEGGIRVPMITRWPGVISADTKSDLVGAFWDFLPTFSQIAGVETPKNIDGISFLPTLRGTSEEQQRHDYLYWEFHKKKGPASGAHGRLESRKI